MDKKRRVVRKWQVDEPSISLCLLSLYLFSEDEAFGLMNLDGKDFKFIDTGSL